MDALKLPAPHQSMRAALFWSLFWVATALVFNCLVWAYFYYTSNNLPFANEKGLDFLAGYLIEKSLSVDNLFAFYMVFNYFRISPVNQQRILMYGISSAIIMRLVLILVGISLIDHFHWLLPMLGALLIFSGAKMLFTDTDKQNIDANKIFTWLGKRLRITDTTEGKKFFVRKQGLLYATPLLFALIYIEITDLIFAFDSIPAIFAITTDPFIVWTSNIFAILGLRAMYFLLAGMANRLYLLKYGIALILVFVGVKMVIAPWIIISTAISLVVIALTLILFSWLSIARNKI